MSDRWPQFIKERYGFLVKHDRWYGITVILCSVASAVSAWLPWIVLYGHSSTFFGADPTVLLPCLLEACCLGTIILVLRYPLWAKSTGTAAGVVFLIIGVVGAVLAIVYPRAFGGDTYFEIRVAISAGPGFGGWLGLLAILVMIIGGTANWRPTRSRPEFKHLMAGASLAEMYPGLPRHHLAEQDQDQDSVARDGPVVPSPPPPGEANAPMDTQDRFWQDAEQAKTELLDPLPDLNDAIEAGKLSNLIDRPIFPGHTPDPSVPPERDGGPTSLPHVDELLSEPNPHGEPHTPNESV